MAQTDYHLNFARRVTGIPTATDTARILPWTSRILPPSIFIFPDVEQTIREALLCLRPGGKIAFSFYPFLEGKSGEDLLTEAFRHLGGPEPRFRVITDYDKACRALSLHCVNVANHRWVRPLDIGFLQDFFSIPAQSASLFPGRDYETRRELVRMLFSTLSDLSESASIVWRMAEGTKAA